MASGRRCVVFGYVITSVWLGVLAADNITETDSSLELEPMVIPGGWQPGSECTCYNSTETERVHHMETEPECRCRGAAFTDIPANISSYMRRLTVADAGIEVLKATALQPYRTFLKDVTLMNVKFLRSIEPGAFNGMQQLRTVYIYQAPALRVIPSPVFRVELPRLKILRIAHTSLEHIPSLSDLKTNSILHMIDLENNLISQVSSGALNVRAEQLLLEYNVIEEVEGLAFNGSQVAKLSLKGNRALRHLHPDAFTGLQSLRYLDLSKTSITHLPTSGLHELDVLRLEDTETLKTFPSIYNFEYIREAWLTYPYHCCAFHFPATHDPAEYARHQV